MKELPTLSIDVIKGFAENMRKSAISLYRLLENLLQWSRMQQGLMPFNPESVLLSELMDESLSAVQESAGQKRIQIKSSIAADLKVVADRNMIQTVIRNLVFNAVKFTHSDGLISISASISSDNKVEISIHDTGIGMNEQILENLFQANRNSIRTGTLGETSTGLGLILCKEFVEKHGGTLWAKSEVGKGSSFIFSLTSSC